MKFIYERKDKADFVLAGIKLFIVICALFLLGFLAGWLFKADRYYLQASGNIVYKMDKITGKTWRLYGTTASLVEENKEK